MSLVSLSRYSAAFLALAGLSSLHADQMPEAGLKIECFQSPATAKGWQVSADFLYLYASQEISDIWADVINIGNNTSSWQAPSFDFTWDPGFRIGAGRRFGSDRWDSNLYWTWFRTSSTHAIVAGPGDTVGAEFFAAFLGDLRSSKKGYGTSAQGDPILKMTGRWSLLYNIADWDLGRSFQVSPSLALRPFIGLKGGWIYQHIDINYSDIVDNQSHYHYSGFERLKNNFWGLGPQGGINTVWNALHRGCHFLNLLGDFSLSTMWGRWVCADNYSSSQGKKYAVNMGNSSLGALMFRGFFGLGWQTRFNQCSSGFALNVGYEMQLWINQLRLPTFQLQRLHGDLTLQGVTLNCRYDF